MRVFIYSQDHNESTLFAKYFSLFTKIKYETYNEIKDSIFHTIINKILSIDNRDIIFDNIPYDNYQIIEDNVKKLTNDEYKTLKKILNKCSINNPDIIIYLNMSKINIVKYLKNNFTVYDVEWNKNLKNKKGIIKSITDAITEI